MKSIKKLKEKNRGKKRWLPNAGKRPRNMRQTPNASRMKSSTCKELNM